MKKIACVLAVVACLYAGVSFVLGGVARDRYFQALEEYGGGNVTLGNESFERGIFTSSAVTLVKAAHTSGEGTEAQSRRGLLLRHTFRHGPFTLSDGFGGLRPAFALVDTALEIVPGDSPIPGTTLLADTSGLYASILIGFGNDVECFLSTAAISGEVNGTGLEMDACTAHVVHDPDTQSWRGAISLPRLGISAGDFSFAANGLSLNFDMVQALPWVFVGQSESVISSMNMTRSGQSVFTAENLRSSAHNSIDGGLLTSRGVLNLQSATAGEYPCGPVVCDMEVRDMNATTIRDAYTDLAGIFANRDVQDPRTALAQLNRRLGERVMAEGVKYGIRRLSVPTSIGALECSLNLALEGSRENASNPLVLLDNLNATAEISVDESLVIGVMRAVLQKQGVVPAAQGGGSDARHDLARQIVAQNVDPMVAQGLLRRDGGTLKADAVFEKGKLLVNNRLVPLP